MPYWYMGYFGIFCDILFWVILIWLIVWLLRKSNAQTNTPLSILNERYAKGDITKKQFEEMKKDVKE